MRDFYSIFLPLGAVVFLIFYVLLIDPHVLTELGWWLQTLNSVGGLTSCSEILNFLSSRASCFIAPSHQFPAKGLSGLSSGT